MAPKRKASSKARRDNGSIRDTTTIISSPKPKVHTFTRTVGYQDITKVAGDVGYGIVFRLNDVPNVSEFVSLFDQYTINWVEYEWINRSALTGIQAPVIYAAPDYDDDGAPTLIEMLQKQNVITFTFSADRTQVKMRIRPNALRQVYRSALTTGYERSPVGTWMDCATPDVPFYGLKYFIQNYNTASTPNTQLGVVVRYSLSFKETI